MHYSARVTHTSRNIEARQSLLGGGRGHYDGCPIACGGGGEAIAVHDGGVVVEGTRGRGAAVSIDGGVLLLLPKCAVASLLLPVAVAVLSLPLIAAALPLP